MRILKQSTARSMVVFMTDSSDHVSGKTGLTLTITASKDGGAFSSISPTVTELANGWYKLALTTSHTDTLGDLALHITAAGADPTDVAAQVCADLPGASVSSVTGNVSGSVGSVAGNVTGSVASVSGNVGGNVVGSVGSVLGNVGGNVVGSVASVIATVNANLTQILGTALTETAGQIAAGFKKFFNVASPASTMESLTQVQTCVQLTNNNDKTGYYLSAGAVQSIWNQIWNTTWNSNSIIRYLINTLGDIASDVSNTYTYTSGIPQNPLLTTDSRLDNLNAPISAIPTISTPVKKNVALSGFQFPMGDVGLTVTAKRSIDGGAFATCTNAVSEISDGWYKIDLSADDLNGKSVALEFSADNQAPVRINLFPEE